MKYIPAIIRAAPNPLKLKEVLLPLISGKNTTNKTSDEISRVTAELTKPSVNAGVLKSFGSA